MRFVPHLALLLVLLCAPAARADAPRALAQRTIAPQLFTQAPAPVTAAGEGDIGVPVRTAPVTPWCGEERTTDDTVNEVQNGQYRFHAVYVIPSDGRSRLRAVAPQLQADLRDASGLLERLYGRALRLDMGTSCGPGYVDFTVVRLKQSTAEIAAAVRQNTVLDVVLAGLDAAGLPVAPAGDPDARTHTLTRNYVAWLDGPAPAEMCGQATMYDDPARREDNWNQLAGKLALVFRDGDGFCSSRAVRHEMAHTMGAVHSGAVHAIDGGHCSDAFEDTMCTAHAPTVGSGDFGQSYFDYGNDDYWDPPRGAALPWWTVNLSRFVCPDTRCNGAKPKARSRKKARAASRRKARAAKARAAKARAAKARAAKARAAKARARARR
jgi:hypothetical protein